MHKGRLLLLGLPSEPTASELMNWINTRRVKLTVLSGIGDILISEKMDFVL